jgi:hypothetical protein
VFSIGGGTTREIVYTNAPPPHPGRPPCSVAPEEYCVTIDEINAASTLQFEPSRKEMLAAIAGREGISDASQEYLVCMSLDKLQFEPSKKEVLETLVNNPDFSPRGKAALLRNLHRLDFEATRTALLREMQGKGDVPRYEPREHAGQSGPTTAPAH